MVRGLDWRPGATLAVARLRARLLQRIRQYFGRTQALEVETPSLVRKAVTDVHIESLRVTGPDGQSMGNLHTSPEYAMKRLLCAGWPDIYQVAHVFRGGERGRRHSPEFTMIEWYRLGIDHHALMDDVECLIFEALSPETAPTASQRIAYREAFIGALGLDPFVCSTQALHRALENAGQPVPRSLKGKRDALLDIALSTSVTASFPRDRLTFLYDFPASQAALARTRGPLASRFEAFWGDIELANGFHELTDVAEQARRFEADLASRHSQGQCQPGVDRLLLAALSSGLPDCSGVAFGFDRLLMSAAGGEHIDEVSSFPFERA